MSTVTKPILLDETGQRIATALESMDVKTHPTKTSDLVNDSGFITMSDVSTKQDKIEVVTSLGAGGRIPVNKVCELGTLSSATVSFTIPAVAASTVENRWMLSFTVGAQVSSISFPSNVVFPATPTWEAGKHYEVSLRHVQSEDKYYALVQSW